MKNIMLFILLITMTLAVTAQTTDPNQPITETERIVDKYLDRADNAISTLAEKLSVPAGHVYKVLVRQQIIIGISTTLAFLIFLIIFIVSTNALIKNKWGEDDETAGVVSVISGIITFILFMVVLIEGLPKLLNPEYEAIKDILGIIQ